MLSLHEALSSAHNAKKASKEGRSKGGKGERRERTRKGGKQEGREGRREGRKKRGKEGSKQTDPQRVTHPKSYNQYKAEVGQPEPCPYPMLSMHPKASVCILQDSTNTESMSS